MSGSSIDEFRRLWDQLEKHPEGQAERLALDLMFRTEQLRHEQGLSYAQLARRIGVSRQHVHKLMSGTQNSTIGSLVKLALALGCELQFTLTPLPVEDADQTENRSPVAEAPLNGADKDASPGDAGKEGKRSRKRSKAG